MGAVYTAACPVCHYEEKFCLGGGRSSINLMMGIRVLSQKEQDAIERMYKSGEIDRFTISSKLTLCSHCGANGLLMDQTIISIIDKAGEKRIFGNQCSECGRELEMFDEQAIMEEKKISCPKCGEGMLHFCKTGLWD
ncbi:MAG: hypothetical protein ACI4DR_02920 [Roseburia sp.]